MVSTGDNPFSAFTIATLSSFSLEILSETVSFVWLFLGAVFAATAVLDGTLSVTSIFKFAPAFAALDFNPFHLLISETVTPYFRAMVDKFSPLLTL